MSTLLEALADMRHYIRCGTEAPEQCPACVRYDALQVEVLKIMAERDALRAEIGESRRDTDRLRDIFRANMLRYVPGVTHEQIDAALDGERCFVNPKPDAAIDAARGDASD
jgi:hypothetical protein